MAAVTRMTVMQTNALNAGTIDSLTNAMCNVACFIAATKLFSDDNFTSFANQDIFSGPIDK